MGYCIIFEFLGVNKYAVLFVIILGITVGSPSSPLNGDNECWKADREEEGGILGWSATTGGVAQSDRL